MPRMYRIRGTDEIDSYYSTKKKAVDNFIRIIKEAGGEITIDDMKQIKQFSIGKTYYANCVSICLKGKALDFSITTEHIY